MLNEIFFHLYIWKFKLQNLLQNIIKLLYYYNIIILLYIIIIILLYYYKFILALFWVFLLSFSFFILGNQSKIITGLMACIISYGPIAKDD